ncbi:hypothetical protein LSUE1_G007077, partial [Lachnellula suecica]
MSSSPAMPQVTQAYLDEYSGNILIGVCAAFVILETVFLALRFYAKSLTQLEWTWEDFLLPLAWVFNIGLCALCINAVPAAGVGRHLAYVVKTDPSKLIAWGKSLAAVEFLYLCSNPLPKIYVVCLYLRIFTNRAARLTCYILICIMIAIWVAFITASATKCHPFAAQWDKAIPGGHCVNIEAYYQSTSAPNIATDLVILILPIPTVIGLHASRLRKFGLLLIFIAGSIGLVGSIIRFTIFFKAEVFTDNTWSSVPLMTWTCVEPGMYLIAACCLTLRPLLGKIPFKSLTTKAGYGPTTAKSATFKETIGSASYHPSVPQRSGFIQMHDINKHQEPRMNVMTTKSFTIDVEAARQP